MSFTTVVSGTTITAAWGNSVRDQLVSPFADSTARTAAVSVPVSGMVSVLTTTKRMDVYNGSSHSALINPSWGAWPSWTTAVTQSGAVTHSINLANYFQVGRMITAQFLLVMTGSGTASNVVTVTLPVTADAAWVGDSNTLGNGYLNDLSATSKTEAALVLASTTTLKFRAMNSTTSPPGFLGQAGALFNLALASGDTLSGTITYAAGADT